MKVQKKYLIILFFVMFIMQFILIAHRLSFKPYLLFSFYLPDAGIKESLEINIDFKNALEIKDFVKKYELKDFNISDGLEKNVSYQRIIEINYPVRLNKNSLNYFSLNSEKKPLCKLKDFSLNISYYECR
jgi:hypothetical protein